MPHRDMLSVAFLLLLAAAPSLQQQVRVRWSLDTNRSLDNHLLCPPCHAYPKSITHTQGLDGYCVGKSQSIMYTNPVDSKPPGCQTSYVVCENRLPKVMNCASQTVFSAVAKACVAAPAACLVRVGTAMVLPMFVLHTHPVHHPPGGHQPSTPTP